MRDQQVGRAAVVAGEQETALTGRAERRADCRAVEGVPQVVVPGDPLALVKNRCKLLKMSLINFAIFGLLFIPRNK